MIRALRGVYLPAVLFFTCFGTASAELVECNGVWTNQSCDSSAKNRLPEEVSTKTDPEQVKAFDEKRALLSAFQSFRRELQKEGDFYLDTLAVDDLCLSSKATVKQCEIVIEKFETRLTKLAELSLKKREKENAKEQEAPQSGGSTVVINRFEEDPYNYRWYRKKRHPKEKETVSKQPPKEPRYTLSEQLANKKKQKEEKDILYRGGGRK